MKTYWAKEIAKDIIKKKGKKLTMATGISPSGPIHIGNMREVLTAELIRTELKKLKANVKFVYIEDDFDRLRKLYPFLPKSFEKYIGWPLSKIPDPKGDSKKTYADRFIEPFFDALRKLNIKMDILSASKLYKEGFYTEKIKIALEKKYEIKQMLTQISGRTMPKNWSPYSPICQKCKKIDEAKVIDEKLSENKVKYRCKCGYVGWADFSKDEGKLAWRVDWPARWASIPIDVEPYGKEHATIGGSYDTGKAICEKIFNSKAPYGIGYDLIYLKGSKGKMSSSLGNVITANEFLEVVPPAILRYLFAKTSYNKPIYFDPGIGFLHLIDEFTKLEEKVIAKKASEYEKDIYFASKGDKEDKIFVTVPFKHLINAIQTSQGNSEEIIRLMKKTGFDEVIKKQEIFKQQVNKAKKWLEKFAPENIKFSILKNTPQINIDKKQKQLLKNIASFMQKEKYDAETLHNKIYEYGKQIGLTPKQTFEIIYLSIIGKPSGPKAGWFIILQDKDFVINRFLEIAK